MSDALSGTAESLATIEKRWRLGLERLQREFQDALARDEWARAVITESVEPSETPLPDEKVFLPWDEIREQVVLKETWQPFATLLNSVGIPWEGRAEYDAPPFCATSQHIGLLADLTEIRTTDGNPWPVTNPLPCPDARWMKRSEADGVERQVAVVPGFMQTVYVYSSSRRNPVRPQTLHAAANEILARAGELLRQAPRAITEFLWQQRAVEFRAPNDAGLWVAAVAELAAMRLPGSPLRTDWFLCHDRPDVRFTMRNWEKFQQHGETWFPRAGEIFSRLPNPPEHNYLALDDLYQASIRAIDVLLSLPTSDDENRSPSKSPSETFSPSEQKIVDIITTKRRRMTTDQLLAELEKLDGAASVGTTKNVLAGLVRRGILNNRQDVRPKGYGLPDWD